MLTILQVILADVRMADETWFLRTEGVCVCGPTACVHAESVDAWIISVRKVLYINSVLLRIKGLYSEAYQTISSPDIQLRILSTIPITMSFRSLLTCVLATAPVAVVASPHGPRDNTVTVTEIKTITAAAACSASSSVVTAYNSTTATPTTPSASNTNPTTTLVATATATNYGLDDAAKAAGKLWFGTAADIPGTGELEDVYYMAQFNNTHDFGEATPANIMKVRHNYLPT